MLILLSNPIHYAKTDTTQQICDERFYLSNFLNLWAIISPVFSSLALASSLSVPFSSRIYSQTEVLSHAN